MDLAVVKQGSKCDAQAAYLERLARLAPERFPRVVARWKGGFAMETLAAFEPHAMWPHRAEWAATRALWCHPSVVFVHWDTWQNELYRTLELRAPKWAWYSHVICATHGDMTMCNTMLGAGGDLVFIDPVYPERVPSIRHVDQARILQSMLGWELMTGRQTEVIDWTIPEFLFPGRLSNDITTTLFWTAIVMARIVASKNANENERIWADHLRQQIMGAIPNA